NKSGFNSDLKEFVQILMKKIMNDIDKNPKLPQSELYSVINLLKFMPKFHQQEILKPTSAMPTKSQQPKTLSPEIIAQIKRDFLGVEE
ncbi:MAG: hypothetical protein LUG16_00315, partial [Candidatus Gastranaerophilales bacterium]|nr:hypothetical protein [Candidatus Gastranaerophilales bacterium]